MLPNTHCTCSFPHSSSRIERLHVMSQTLHNHSIRTCCTALICMPHMQCSFADTCTATCSALVRNLPSIDSSNVWQSYLLLMKLYNTCILAHAVYIVCACTYSTPANIEQCLQATNIITKYTSRYAMLAMPKVYATLSVMWLQSWCVVSQGADVTLSWPSPAWADTQRYPWRGPWWREPRTGQTRPRWGQQPPLRW